MIEDLKRVFVHRILAFSYRVFSVHRRPQKACWKGGNGFLWTENEICTVQIASRLDISQARHKTMSALSSWVRFASEGNHSLMSDMLTSNSTLWTCFLCARDLQPWWPVQRPHMWDLHTSAGGVSKRRHHTNSLHKWGLVPDIPWSCDSE